VADVYWHRGRRLWSVREGGRVVAHVEAIGLRDVVLRASEKARIRCMRTGVKDVHAWAAGSVMKALRPAGAVRLLYRLAEPGFRVDGAVVIAAAAAWFEADGTAWIEGVGVV
jgi:hypothetical protein